MIHTDLVYILTTLCNLFENIYGLCFCNVNILRVCKNIHENFFYSKVFPGIKYAGKAKKKEGMPAFQNIKDLTNGSSEGARECSWKLGPLFTKASEAVFRRRSVKKIFLKVSRNSQKNNYCWGLALIKLQARKRLQRRWFSLDIAKFSRTPFLWNTSGGCFWGL